MRRPPLPFSIVFEDRDVLVIDKPPGLITSSGARDRRPTAWKAAQDYLSSQHPSVRPGLIHRLDRDAGGLLVFSKNDAAYRSLKTQFFDHTVTRCYAAIVHGRINPAAGRIDSHLIEWVDGSVHSSRRGGQRAVTDYETVECNKSRSLLRLTLLTGRKHQIRVQLSERGHPIVGDAVYGDGGTTSKSPRDSRGSRGRHRGGDGGGNGGDIRDNKSRNRPDNTGRAAREKTQLMLVAIELAFDHPATGRRLALSKALPEFFAIE